jgi:hypothetical protein
VTDLKKWAAGFPRGGEGPHANDSHPKPSLTPAEAIALKILCGPKMSDGKRAQASGLDHTVFRDACWSVREKLRVKPGEELKAAAKRQGLL